MDKKTKRIRTAIQEFFSVESSNQQFLNIFRLMFSFCAITHAAFLLAFSLMGIPELAIFNSVSVAAYLFCFLCTFKPNYYLTIFIAYVEIIAFSILSVLCLGWSANIQYFMICIIPMGFFFPFKKIACPVTATSISALIYLFLLVYSNNSEPWYDFKSYGLIASIIEYGSIVTCLLVVLILSYLFSNWLQEKEALLKTTNETLERLANTDTLTGLPNRRSMINAMRIAVSNCGKTHEPALVVLGDIDDFKSVNDTYGHDFGDTILIQIAQLMQTTMKDIGNVCRWGGEEFLIIIEKCPKEKGKQIIDNLCHKISEMQNVCQEKAVNVTMTFGVSELTDSTNIDNVISQADIKLYVGKSHGKNCVIV